MDFFYRRKWWVISQLVSLSLVFMLISLWSNMNLYRPINEQITSDREVQKYLEKYTQSKVLDFEKIKTGIFIQSMKFFDSTEVNISGYIWQRYYDGVNEHLKPEVGEVGFILPEQVNSGSDIFPREVYRYKSDGVEVIGWYFEATLRQPFNYKTYPFDHKTVWVRLWPKDFSGNVILVPDFESYNSTGINDIFGIEGGIVLGAWERENTFFDYKLSDYDTNFGIDGYVGQNNFPELHYNFVIKRKFINAFVVHLLPLLLVAALLYGTLLTVSDDEMALRHGFSTAGVISSCSALFFVVLLAHIQLREQFSGVKIVYMEWFYFLMYGLLVLSSAYAFLFSSKFSTGTSSAGYYRDNLLVKLGFWPFLFLLSNIITISFNSIN